jgi:hypothetical protein
MPRDNQNQPSGCHSFIGRSDAKIMGADRPAVVRLWRKGAGPEDTSGKSPQSRPCDAANAKSSLSPIRAAHAEFVRVLVGQPPQTIPLMADALDLEDRGDHLGKVLTGLSAYVAVVLDDTAQNVPGRLDLPDVEAVLADLASDVTGAIQKAADDMAGRPA